MKPLSGMARYCDHKTKNTREDRFGRLFPDLPASYTSPTILKDLGKKKGPMDKKSDRTKTVPVGHVFFGQFIDHDITLDVFSKFDEVNEPTAIENLRTPTLDLDCIFGAGHEAANFMYHSEGEFKGIKLLTGADAPQTGTPEDKIKVQNDLLRSINTHAIIGDFRNDENRIISQMQLRMIDFYNILVDHYYKEEKLRGEELREVAQRQTRWHYQWAVVNDFLKTMCGAAVVDRILTHGRKYYCGGVPFIPVEFAVAAYRFGHSMAPQEIQVQRGDNAFTLFGDILGKGFTPVEHVRAIVDWHELFDTDEDRDVQRADQLDTKMASILLELPFVTGNDEKSLATRNMLRGNSFLLPGGDVIAHHMERPEDEIANVVGLISEQTKGDITSGAPLWYYILAEAEVIGRETSDGSFEPGEGLGPVGATIVAETIIGLLEFDTSSYLGANRNWEPKAEFDNMGKIMSVFDPSFLYEKTE